MQQYIRLLYEQHQGISIHSNLFYNIIHLGHHMIYFMYMYVTQTFRHGFPHQPTCLDYDPVQQLLAIGAQNGKVVLYPYTIAMEIVLPQWHWAHEGLSVNTSVECRFMYCLELNIHVPVVLLFNCFVPWRIHTLGKPGLERHIIHPRNEYVLQIKFVQNKVHTCKPNWFSTL